MSKSNSPLAARLALSHGSLINVPPPHLRQLVAALPPDVPVAIETPSESFLSSPLSARDKARFLMQPGIFLRLEFRGTRDQECTIVKLVGYRYRCC